VKHARLIAKILVSAAVLAALFHWIDIADLHARLRGISFLPFCAAIAINLGMQVLNALKLFLLFPPPRPPLAGIVRVNLITVFVSTFIPGGVGGELARWGFLSAASGSRDRAFAAVLLDRITGLWAQILLSMLAWMWLSRGTVGLWAALPLAGTVLSAGVWASLWGYRRFIQGMRLLGAWYARRKGGCALVPDHLDEALADLLADRGRFLRVAALSVGNHLLVGAIFLLIDRSIGGSLGLAQALIFLFWYALILVLPVTLGTWGLSEGTLGVLYHYAGSQSAVGVLISLLIRVMNIPVMALGLWFFLRSGAERRREALHPPGPDGGKEP
jgi:hypothetical protein